MKIRFDNTESRTYTVINGKKYNQKELSKLLSCKPNAIYQAYKRYKEDYKKVIWILDRMYSPSKSKKIHKPRMADWKGLGSRVRDENLKGIPDSTEYEKSMFGI